MTDTLLITGAAGQLGRIVLDELLAAGVAPATIIATTRDVTKLSGYAAKGVQVRPADFDDPSSLEAAFAGAGKILIVSTDALDRPGRRLEQHRTAVAAAKKAGAKHILYTSMPQPDDSLVAFAPDHLGTEEAIKATGIPYTIFRNGWYFENLFLSVPQALKSGKWFTSAGTGRIGYAARADMGAAIAARLRSAGSDSKTYTLTGTASYSTDEIAALVAAATGKPLEVVHLDDAKLQQGLEAAGVPGPVASVFVSFDANTREGKIATLTDDLASLAARPLQPLAAYIEANKGALAG